MSIATLLRKITFAFMPLLILACPFSLSSNKFRIVLQQDLLIANDYEH